MRLTKGNTAGLTFPLQRAEMKSILAGTWPPLKPLPVFRYETVEYHATIDFDKRRGEWVCRKTSLSSNKVQELRGGLKEIAMTLPPDEAEMLTDDQEQEEQQEEESEKDTNRRLQAIQEWRENYQNGALYFELRDHLSESQRTELDDSLRLSLTAKQLQFNSKNVAKVFDDLSIAGGRFAALIEFAKRNKAKPGTNPRAQEEGAAPEGERAIEPCPDPDDFPAVSIKDVFPEQSQAGLAERMGHTAPQQFEMKTSEKIADADSPSAVEHPHQKEHYSPSFSGFVAHVRTGQSSADRIAGSSSRLPAIEISAFQVTAVAFLSLFAAIAFTVGLTVGRGRLAKTLREASKSMLALDAKSPALPGQAHESRTATPLVASSDDSTGAKGLAGATSHEGKPNESTHASEPFAEVRSTGSNSSPATEPKPSAKPEINSEHSATIGPNVRNFSPPANSKPALSRKAVAPISGSPRRPDPYRPNSPIAAAPHLPRSSTILVTVPAWGSQPFRVRFPETAIAASSSFAITSQLSVLVSPAEPSLAHKPARLETGVLVSFVWPRYPMPGDRHIVAETIRVHATIGQLGQVLEVKFLSGSLSLFPATMRAIRKWRYRPTLLNERPVQAEQDFTIEFRPPQYSAQVSTRHSSHNW